MKVHLHTRRPENQKGVTQEAEFERIPVIGEYVSIFSSDEYCYKVVLVLHKPLADKGRVFPPDYVADVYAIGVGNPFDVQKASGYFPK